MGQQLFFPRRQEQVIAKPHEPKIKAVHLSRQKENNFSSNQLAKHSTDEPKTLLKQSKTSCKTSQPQKQNYNLKSDQQNQKP